MVAVQPWAGDGGDEELRAVGVRTGVGHRQLARLGVFDFEVLVLELVAVDGFASVPVVVGDVTTLRHEPWDHSVENRVLVAEALFARAQRSEVLGGLWNGLVEQVEDNSWLLGATNGQIKIDLG